MGGSGRPESNQGPTWGPSSAEHASSGSKTGTYVLTFRFNATTSRVETILTCAPMASNGSAYMLTIQAHLGDEPTDAIRESIATRAAAARAAMG